MFRATHVYRARGMGGQQREEFYGAGLNFMLLLQVLPFLIIILLAYLPFSEPDYSLRENYAYQVPKTTEKYGIEFYVKSAAFDKQYPLGSPAQADIEDSMIKDYRNMLRGYYFRLNFKTIAEGLCKVERSSLPKISSVTCR
ncbi:hypothetical protein TIFTF001_055042 [Ficus carica]|uniref:DUF1977 domain-containing protein n=1 Tax=Ficus carica TaxID=3494 RepID=A0AA88EBF4_FICCA|nr:hypothetical protein TIFTF001_055042 [Ficus carica]